MRDMTDINITENKISICLPKKSGVETIESDLIVPATLAGFMQQKKATEYIERRLICLHGQLIK